MPGHRFTRFWHSPLVRGTRHLFSADRWYRAATAGQRKLPDFIIAGAQKSGTTSLYAYLGEHPSVQTPAIKDVSFFDSQFQRGLAWYRSHFPLASQRSLEDGKFETTQTCESTAYYLFHPHAARRIASLLPEVKIILLLRNPVDRAFSHYQLNLRRGNEELSFEEALAAEERRLDGEERRMLKDESYASFEHEKHSYLARGRYAEQIERWQQFFPAERLLILDAETLFREPAATFAGTLRFLGLPAWTPERFGNRFPGRYQARMSSETRHRLTDYFAPHNARLASLLGRDLNWNRSETSSELCCSS